MSLGRRLSDSRIDETVGGEDITKSRPKRRKRGRAFTGDETNEIRGTVTLGTPECFLDFGFGMVHQP